MHLIYYNWNDLFLVFGDKEILLLIIKPILSNIYVIY